MTGSADWDARYQDAERLFVAEPDEELVSRVRGLPAGRAADLGAGEGRNALWLARNAWEVTAVDFSGVAISRLRALAAAGDLVVGTRCEPIDQFVGGFAPFDLVVLANIHPERDERPRLLAAAVEAVAPGGYLFVVGHHVDSFGRGGPPDPERLYREDDLAAALRGLDVIEMKRLERAHGDVAAPVVDLVAWARRPLGK